MIYTVTLNPSIDYIVSVENFQLGKTNRTTSEFKNPGGKGINVSRVLNNLTMKSKVLGFVGGFTGGFIQKELEKESIDSDFIEVSGDTRINVKLRSEEETEINGQSPMISPSNMEQLKGKLKKIKKGDYLVLAGSVPNTLPPTVYADLMKEVEGKGAYIVVDTSGVALKESIHSKPFLIKPNHHELGELFGKSKLSFEETVAHAKQLVAIGVQHVFVSMAGKGAVFVSQENTMFANVPMGTVRNSVGAGDSSVAGFIASYNVTGNVETAFRYGIAAGSATAFTDGFCEKNEIDRLYKEINIKYL